MRQATVRQQTDGHIQEESEMQTRINDLHVRVEGRPSKSIWFNKILYISQM